MIEALALIAAIWPFCKPGENINNATCTQSQQRILSVANLAPVAIKNTEHSAVSCKAHSKQERGEINKATKMRNKRTNTSSLTDQGSLLSRLDMTCHSASRAPLYILVRYNKTRNMNHEQTRHECRGRERKREDDGREEACAEGGGVWGGGGGCNTYLQRPTPCRNIKLFFNDPWRYGLKPNIAEH
jgi:hypothetical protein